VGLDQCCSAGAGAEIQCSSDSGSGSEGSGSVTDDVQQHNSMIENGAKPTNFYFYHKEAEEKISSTIMLAERFKQIRLRKTGFDTLYI
jgi:hypothetical protein